jgi:DNA repair exonuclease SbcCD nuclease subunit
MKILFTGDWHLDAFTAGVERLPEIRTFVERLKLEIVKRKIDVGVFLGDAFDPGGLFATQYAREIMRMIDDMACLTRLGTFLSVAGNHDVVESSEVVTTLSPLAEMATRKKPQILTVAESPRLEIMGRTGFLLLPHTARARDALDETTAVLKSAYEKRNDLQIIPVGHMTVPGAVMGSESKEMARGRDIELPFQALSELHPVLAINGHYHRRQIVRVGGLDVLMPGAPLRFAFDGDDSDKGFFVADV